MSKYKKCGSRKCKRKKRCKCKKRRYQRDHIVRTTKCKGGCVPTTSQIINGMKPFGGQFTQGCDGRVVGQGTVGCGTVGCGLSNRLADPTQAGFDRRFDHLTTGAYPGSTESHLHIDRFGSVFGHSHSGGDQPHSHDVCGEDRYVGRVNDLRSLTQNPDSLDQDVLGGIPGVCGVDEHCLTGQTCVGGRCAPSTANLVSCDPGIGAGCNPRAPVPTTTQTVNDIVRFGGVRPYTGNLVGGFRDTESGDNLRFTSGSFVDGSTLAVGNLAASAPSNPNTLPPSSLNTRQKTPNLQGFNNEGLSCITAAMCGTKRPTVCRTKIKEVYCC